jgi:rSAM/selenodomain-associated transferase 2
MGTPQHEGQVRPSLSLVIPVLDEAGRLPVLLARLEPLRDRAEVIVVDGGSADGTADVARAARWVRVLAAPAGRARQMNAGAAAAAGDVLLFLHADTILPRSALEDIRGALADPRVVGGRFDVRLDGRRPIYRVVETLMNLRSRWTGIWTGDQAIFVRRTAFERLGGYPDIPLMEDVEFTRRLKRAGPGACLQPRVIVSPRKWEREGPVRTILLMWSLRLLYGLGVAPARLHRWYYR